MFQIFGFFVVYTLKNKNFSFGVPGDQTLEFCISSIFNFISYFTIFVSSFKIYILFCNLSSVLGANLDILEDKYCKRGDK